MVYGIGTDLSDQEWRVVFRQLVALDLAQVDHGAHGALQLTEASRPVLRGECSVQMRRLVVRPRGGRGQRGGGGRDAPGRAALAAGLSGAQAEVFARLRAWRAEQARTQSVPAYVILHDATLAEIAQRAPTTIDALTDIGGMGAKKLERYGTELLELLQLETED